MRKEDAGFVERAPVVHVAEADVAVARRAVFAAFAEPRGWKHWFPSVRDASYTTGPPYAVGTIREADVGGTRWVEEMIAWEEGRRWGWSVLRASVPFARAQVECFDFADAPGGGTRVDWTLALDPRLIARLGSRFAAPAIRSLLARATANLDTMLKVPAS